MVPILLAKVLELKAIIIAELTDAVDLVEEQGHVALAEAGELSLNLQFLPGQERIPRDKAFGYFAFMPVICRPRPKSKLLLLLMYRAEWWE